MRGENKMRVKITTAAAVLILFVTATTATAQSKMAPETRNAALRYWLAFADLRDAPGDKAQQELLEKTATGEVPWDEAKLGPILDQNQNAIEEMQRATKLPECDWGLEYSLGSRASIAYVPRARVLARLNTLYGMRVMSKGQTQAAIDSWLDGIRFSQHVAQGGSLIFKLVARMSLLSNFNALTDAVQSGQFDEAQKTKIAFTLRALPEDGFDWAEALALDEASFEISLQQMRHAANPAAYYQEIMGKQAPADFSVPSQNDIAARRALVAKAEAALRMPPEQAREPLQDLQGRISTLHPFFQGTVPSFVKINDARAEVYASRQKLLQALARS
jgi:hypothetical protein